jgi:hypothetical protein
MSETWDSLGLVIDLPMSFVGHTMLMGNTSTI